MSPANGMGVGAANPATAENAVACAALFALNVNGERPPATPSPARAGRRRVNAGAAKDAPLPVGRFKPEDI